MPRNLHTGAPSRPRARITQKTRLKIYQGDHEADVVLIPDEDEEKTRLTNLVAGVDAEDANEHHLQAVLTAHSHQPHSRSTRGAVAGAAGDKVIHHAPAQAFIPTPDSTGIVDNYNELYPANRWKDPATYLATSTTVEEACDGALADSFTYYMDERDKEWLDKNNEEARGEGTSAQGSVSSSATRTSSRSTRGKGKEPESIQPQTVTEDEFELVMGLFERITHEKTEYLHHGLENGMTFPSFSEYQEAFSTPLPTSTFASFVVPAWIPQPVTLVRIARIIYPHWKERRLERGGHRIIPTLNFDEGDTLNESYICFRRREIKAVRKTRAAQAPASDKLIRLQAELTYPLELAKAILQRETHKKEVTQQTQQVWEKRQSLVDLKRQYPALGDRGDDELLVDKERSKKTETARATKIRAEPGLLTRVEVALRPSERTNLINEAVETALNRQKERDHHWEDQVDNPYQTPPVPHTTRLFKYIPVNFQASESDGRPILEGRRQPRAVRTRRGRAGRLIVDRQGAQPRPIVTVRTSLFGAENADVEMPGLDDDETARKLQERWRYDTDDVPAVDPEGPEEQNRVLVDDYSSRFLVHSMTMLADVDQQSLLTDPSIPVIIDGHQRLVQPYRLGINPNQLRRNVTQPPPPRGYPQALPGAARLPAPATATPVSAQQQMQMKMPPPSAILQLRISSNGGVRPPMVVASIQGAPAVSQASTPKPAIPTPLQHPPPTSGMSRAAINMPHVAAASDLTPTTQNGVIQVPQSQAQCGPPDSNQPQDLKAIQQQQHQQLFGMVGPNGYHLNPLASQAAAQFAAYQHGLSAQQMQHLKATFANMPPGQDLQAVARAIPTYLQVPGPRSSVLGS